MSYVYDEDGTLIADTLTGGATTTWGQSAKYIYLPTASGPMPVAAIYGSGNTAKHYAIQSDHLNTPRRLTQSDGQVAWQWAYSAFGDEQPTIANNRFANIAQNQSFGTTTVPAVTFNLRYPGQYFDQESNLHYNYHRSYSATTGRYTQADPIGLDGGWNRFGYVDSDPLSDTDPLGLSRLRGNANRPSTPILRPPPRPISLQPFSTYSTESMNQCGVCLQIYFIARLNGEQSGHRTIANNQFYQYLSSGASPLNARQVQRQMSSGSSGLLNPTGYEWHHPVGRPNEIWLVTRCDHRDSLLRPFIHPLPGGGGGFSENFPGGYR